MSEIYYRTHPDIYRYFPLYLSCIDYAIPMCEDDVDDELSVDLTGFPRQSHRARRLYIDINITRHSGSSLYPHGVDVQ